MIPKTKKYTSLGQFQLESTVLRITDPLYSRNSQCSGTLDGCLSGIWDASIVLTTIPAYVSGTYSAMLAAKIQSESFGLFDSIWSDDSYCYWGKSWTEAPFSVYVDSAMAGIFDDKYYSVNDVYMEECFALTSHPQNGGVFPHGAISSSGLGDGAYPALFHKGQMGKIDAVAVIFL